MRILISGGTGMIGTALAGSLLADGHQVWVLTRDPGTARLPEGAIPIGWDSRNDTMSGMDAVVNLAGESLAHWPWTARRKRRFLESRVRPGQALVEAIRTASPRPKVLIQASGINHYGLRGETADENTPPGDDFLARLTVDWEAATGEVEELGVRRCIIRTAVVLAHKGGLLPLMALPVRSFVGGPLGGGQQAVPWVHITDTVAVLRRLLEDETARGPFNLIAPEQTSNAAFYRALARSLKRPYWFPTPAFLLRWTLGEMAVLVVEGRYARPARLLEAGYRFHFETVEAALQDLLAGKSHHSS